MTLIGLSKALDPQYCAVWLGNLGLVLFIYQLVLMRAGVKLRAFSHLGGVAVAYLGGIILFAYLKGFKGIPGDWNLLGQYLILGVMAVSLVHGFNNLFPTGQLRSKFYTGLVILIMSLLWISVWPQGVQMGLLIGVGGCAFLALFVWLVTFGLYFSGWKTGFKSWYQKQLDPRAVDFAVYQIPWERLSEDQLHELYSKADKEISDRDRDFLKKSFQKEV